MIRRLEQRDIPTPPFWGSKLAGRMDPEAVLPYLNRPVLFGARWGYRGAGRRDREGTGHGGRAGEAARRAAEELDRLLEQCRNEDLLDLRAVYGYYPCHAEGNDVVVRHPPRTPEGTTGGERLRFRFPRRGLRSGVCLADYFLPVGAGVDLLALQVVTVGGRVSEISRRLHADNRFKDMLILHGFAGSMAEALAEYQHRRIRRELGMERGGQDGAVAVRAEPYRGRRYSFGYPACPRLEDQALLFELLRPGRIGVTLNDSFQMVPEHSTSAIIVHHPQAGAAAG